MQDDFVDVFELQRIGGSDWNFASSRDRPGRRRRTEETAVERGVEDGNDERLHRWTLNILFGGDGIGRGCGCGCGFEREWMTGVEAKGNVGAAGLVEEGCVEARYRIAGK